MPLGALMPRFDAMIEANPDSIKSLRAFWIPDVGDNKTNQAQLDSEDYLKANKLSVKRFIVPHAKLSGTGSFWDFFVPAGRLIIVLQWLFQ